MSSEYKEEAAEGQIICEPSEKGRPIENSEKAAQKLVDLIKAGHTPNAAARQLGYSWKALKSRPEVVEAIQGLLAAYTLPPHIDKELVRAARRKVLVENLGNSDVDSQKLVLDATKQIASDPDVGLNAPPQILVNVDLRHIDEVLEKPVEPIEGLEDVIER